MKTKAFIRRKYVCIIVVMILSTLITTLVYEVYEFEREHYYDVEYYNIGIEIVGALEVYKSANSDLYPEMINDLVNEGYLHEMPISPVSGKSMEEVRFVSDIGSDTIYYRIQVDDDGLQYCDLCVYGPMVTGICTFQYSKPKLVVD